MSAIPQAQNTEPAAAEEQTTFKHQQSLVTLVTLANAAELTARVVTQLNQDGVASSVGGETMTDSLVHHLAGSVFNKKIAQELKG